MRSVEIFQNLFDGLERKPLLCDCSDKTFLAVLLFDDQTGDFREKLVQADENMICNEYLVVTQERTDLFPCSKNCGVSRSFHNVVELLFAPKQTV